MALTLKRFSTWGLVVPGARLSRRYTCAALIRTTSGTRRLRLTGYAESVALLGCGAGQATVTCRRPRGDRP